MGHFGVWRDMEGSGVRRELCWSELVEEWGLIESLSRDTLVSGRSSC